MHQQMVNGEVVEPFIADNIAINGVVEHSFLAENPRIETQATFFAELHHRHRGY